MLTHATWVDAIVLVWLLCAVVGGARRGLVSQVLAIVAAVLGILLALANCMPLADVLRPYVPVPQAVRVVLTFVAIYALVALSCRLITGFWKDITKETALSWLDSVGGGILGGLRILLVAAVCLQLLSLVPVSRVATAATQSLTLELTGPVTRTVWKMLPELTRTLREGTGHLGPLEPI